MGNPKMVGAASGSFVETWQFAGGEICAATEDTWSERGLNLSEDVVNLGSVKTPSTEDIIAADIEFLVCNLIFAIAIQTTYSLTSHKYVKKAFILSHNLL